MTGPVYVCHAPPSIRKCIVPTPLRSSVAESETLTEDVYQLFAPPVPLSKHVLTGAIVSETLPGESAYVEGTDAGIVIPMTPFEVDRALRIWLPPRVRL